MEDNARKFIVKPIDSNFLKQNNAISFTLIVDWMITEEDSEKKLVHKTFDTGEIQFWLVEKVIENGSRTTHKTKLTEAEYKHLKDSFILIVHLEKRRYEFNFIQKSTPFALKYDEFEGSGVYILEVDGKTEEERVSFEPPTFPYHLQEVTGDIKYYGYRVAKIL